jgi:hypothetical protein
MRFVAACSEACAAVMGEESGRDLREKKAAGSWCGSTHPATWEVEIGGSQFEASLGQVSKTLAQKNKDKKPPNWVWWYIPIIPAT